MEEVSDDRFTRGTGAGQLELKFKLSGDGMDGVEGVRIQVKAAHDDQENSILPKESRPGAFENPSSSLSQKATLLSPARRASSVYVSGTAELFAPKRDPSAIVTVPNAFKNLDKPLSSKGLKAAKVQVTVFSRDRWAEEVKKEKLDDKAVAKIRAEAKKEGISEKEIDAMIELSKIMSEAFGKVPENGVILNGPRAGMDLIHSVMILGPDGEEIHVEGSSGQSDEDTKTTILHPSKPVPPNASLRFSLLTNKARVVVPFELKEVPLP